MQVEASVLVHIDPILGCVFLSIPLHAVFNIESHIMSFTSTFLYYPCRLGCLCHGQTCLASLSRLVGWEDDKLFNDLWNCYGDILGAEA